jgi:hypothetical protein
MLENRTEIVNESRQSDRVKSGEGHQFRGIEEGVQGQQKNAGLKAVTLIATLNPVSQVLW